MKQKIAVIGSGGWGTAISMLLAKKGYNVCLWSYKKEESEDLEKYRENKPFLSGVILPDGISFTSSLAEAAKDCEIIFMVTPSSATKITAKNLAPFVEEGTIIVNASKGFTEDTLERLSVTIKKEIPKAKVCVMSGPSHAEEVARGLPTTNVVACDDLEISKKIQDLIMSDTFRVYTTDDMVGVELGGALKNVIALCAGVSDGLELGDNAKAALMTRGMAEIARLGAKEGGKIATFSGLSGMGDLIVTCTSKHSRNRRAGILIAKGMDAKQATEEIKMVVEGINACKAAYELSKRNGIDMPIVSAAYSVLFEGKSAKDAVCGLMSREKRQETEDIIDGFLGDIN